MSTITNLRNPGKPIHIGVVLMGGVTEILDVAVIEIMTCLNKTFVEKFPDITEELKATALDVVYHWVSEAGPATPSRLTSGISLLPTDSFETCPPLDIVVMGAHLDEYTPNATELAFVRKIYETSAAFLVVCGGIQVPLMAGLLDGKKATGPRMILNTLREQSPTTEWLEKRWVRDGKLWTSGTLLNGMDLAHAFAHETWGNSEGESLVGYFTKVTAWPCRDVDYKDVPWSM